MTDSARRGVSTPLGVALQSVPPSERSSQVPQEESASPTQVTSVWPLRFPVLCIYGSPVAEPVSMSHDTVLPQDAVVFHRGGAGVAGAAHSPWPRTQGVSHPGRTRCRRAPCQRPFEAPTASPNSWEIPRLLFQAAWCRGGLADTAPQVSRLRSEKLAL